MKKELFETAECGFERVIMLEAANAVAWNGKGTVLSSMSQPEPALAAFETALRFDSQMAQAWSNKGLVLRKLKRYQEALEAFQRALRLDRDEVSFWNSKGIVLLDLGRFDDRVFQVKLNPRLVTAWHNISLVLKHIRRYSDALEAAEQAIGLAPQDPDNWQRKADTLRKLHRRKDARAAEIEVARLRTNKI